jgi:hypothetical protein
LKPETEQKLKEILKGIGLGTREEAIAQAISDLSDEAKLEFFTYVYPFEDESLSVMQTIAERYGLEWLGKLVNRKLRLRTSLQGWRANQIVQVAAETQKQKQANWLMRNIFQRNGDKNKKEVADFE